MAKKTSLDLAIEAAGSQVELGRILGKTQQAISKWKKVPNFVLSVEHALKVEGATGVSLSVLRPDFVKVLKKRELAK